jgi:hypothetical protein
LAFLRRKGGYTEEEIAHKLKFGNPEAMRIQLRNWELPGWLAGGEPASNHSQQGTLQRRARTGAGEAIELPPAADAVPLFREVLERLLSEVEELLSRKEYLKDGRFLVERDTQEDSAKIFGRLWREDFTGEEWRKFMEERGEDPESEFVDVPMTDYRTPGGASPVPPEPLTTLVGAYVLAGGEPGPLIDALHPVLGGSDRKELEGRLERMVRSMRTEAQRYATGVRGGEVKTGRKPEGLTETEHAAAIYVKERREQGASDEKIVEELRRTPLYATSHIGLEEVGRLGDLRLD